MKRKGKIITTIASLALAVALLAFGVYAATQVSVGVTSKVKFEVVDVFVDISGAARQGTIVTETGTGTESMTTNSTTGSKGPKAEIVSWAAADSFYTGGTYATPDATYEKVQTYTGTADTVMDPLDPAAGDVNSTDVPDWTIGDFKFTSAIVWFEFTLTVENKATEDPVYVWITDGLQDVTNTWNEAMYQLSGTGISTATWAVLDNGTNGAGVGEANEITVAVGQTLVLRFRLRVENLSAKISGAEGAPVPLFGSNGTTTLNAKKVAYVAPQP